MKKTCSQCLWWDVFFSICDGKIPTAKVDSPSCEKFVSRELK